jgi:hypothetical protein
MNLKRVLVCNSACVYLCILFFIEAAMPVAAMEPVRSLSDLELSLSASLLLQPRAHDVNGVESYSLYYSPGVFWRHSFVTRQYVRAGIELHTDEYIYIQALSSAFPTQIESGRESGALALILGLNPSVAYFFEFPLSESSCIGIGPGLDVLLRIPLLAIDESTGIDEIWNYLHRNGKFLFPALHAYYTFTLPNGFRSGFWTRAQVPIFRLWDGEQLLLNDNLILSAGLHFFIPL